jgi:hypothetical protein
MGRKKNMRIDMTLNFELLHFFNGMEFELKASYLLASALPIDSLY